MNPILEKVRSTFFPNRKRTTTKGKLIQRVNFNPNVQVDAYFPKGFHVHGIIEGPDGDLMVGAENPATSEGSIFLQQPTLQWKRVPLPDETAWLSQFIRLKNGSYVAAGMSLLGRAAILISDPTAESWKSIELDLHSFSMINSLVRLSNGDLLAATGHMITQGKTKPILLRSKDEGQTWEKEEIRLPITQFHTLFVDGSRIYAGPSGDHDPILYVSDDFGVTWTEIARLPSYKTYKTIAFQPIMLQGRKCLLALIWGYKLDIADRVVRLYISDESVRNWSELPVILNSHFVFSFFVAPDQTFYVGSEKGMVLKSTDLGRSWQIVEQFSTNIGAYAIYQDEKGDIWFARDSLWKLKKERINP